LLLHGWLLQERPRLYVFTDGSGRDGVSRLDATTRLLESGGIDAGSLYGRYPDRVIYEALLDGDTALFTGLAQELAKSLAGERIERVVGDAAEGWNPIHDAFRLTVDAAAALASRDTGTEIGVFEYALFGAPGPGAAPERAHAFALDARAREAKRAAALAYTELDREVRFSIERHGEVAYHTEWLRPAPLGGEYPVPEDPPVYERYGEFLMRSGQLDRAIRYREHVLPVADALAAVVAR
jgi:hypothetical protein